MSQWGMSFSVYKDSEYYAIHDKDKNIIATVKRGVPLAENITSLIISALEGDARIKSLESKIEKLMLERGQQ